MNSSDLALLVLRVADGVAGWFEGQLGFKPVTIVAHVPKGFWAGDGGLEFPVPLAAGALAVALIGNGAYSLDRVLGLTYSETLVGLWWIAMAVGVALVFISRAMFAPKTAPKTT